METNVAIKGAEEKQAQAEGLARSSECEGVAPPALGRQASAVLIMAGQCAADHGRPVWC